MFVHLYRGSSTSERVSGKKVFGVYLADVELLLQYVGLLPSTAMWRGMEPYESPTGWSVGGAALAGARGEATAEEIGFMEFRTESRRSPCIKTVRLWKPQLATETAGSCTAKELSKLRTYYAVLHFSRPARRVRRGAQSARSTELGTNATLLADQILWAPVARSALSNSMSKSVSFRTTRPR